LRRRPRSRRIAPLCVGSTNAAGAGEVPLLLRLQQQVTNFASIAHGARPRRGLAFALLARALSAQEPPWGADRAGRRHPLPRSKRSP